MRWEPGLGVFLKDLHFGRLLASARYFAVPLERAALEEAVECVVASLGSSVQRIRLVVACDGSIDVQAEPFVLQSNQPQRVALAATVVDRRDVRFYHKSTVRSFYDRASDSVGADAEALLCNSEGEITESVIANVVYRLNGQLYTPPVACGLLAGTLRKQLLLDGVVHERILRRDELAMVEQLYLVNALRGWREAQWVPNPND
jgi:para-aminobenzoate synthetase/4-amino-4-deoxychorismate lyase